MLMQVADSFNGGIGIGPLVNIRARTQKMQVKNINNLFASNRIPETETFTAVFSQRIVQLIRCVCKRVRHVR